MSTLTAITMPFEEAVNAFNALLPHVGKDATTPIIGGVHWAPDGTLLATDRYTVGRYKPEKLTFTGDEFSGATMPVEAVKFIAAMRPAKLAMGKNEAHNYVLRFTFDSSAQNVRIELGYGDGFVNAEMSAAFATLDQTDYRGYPNVARLFPDESTEFGTSGPLSLRASFIDRASVAVKWLGGLGNGDGCARWQFTKTENPAKPGPVYIQVGERFDMLVQPNLLVR